MLTYKAKPKSPANTGASPTLSGHRRAAFSYEDEILQDVPITELSDVHDYIAETLNISSHNPLRFD